MNHVYKRPNLSLMIFFSFLFHLVFISLAIIIPLKYHPLTISSKKGYRYYEVNLVEIPYKERRVKRSIKKGGKRKYALIKKEVLKGKEIVIPKKRIKIRRKIKEERIIERAIAKIKAKVKREEKYRIEEAIEKIKKRIEKKKVEGVGEGTVEGLSLSLYKLQVENRIKSNWVYPYALLNPGKRNLEAIVILLVKKDGKIVRFWFKKRSNDAIFDSSVIKAIKKSNPLPPFPEGYKKSYEKIEVRFNLSELTGF